MSNTLLTLLNTERLQDHYRAGFWGDDTIYSLVRHHAEQNPRKVAVRTANQTCTYHELVEAADLLANDMADRGIGKGHRVAVWLPSRIETVVAFIACSRNGYICCPSLHRDHTTSDIISLMNRMRAASLIAQPGYGADAAKQDIFSKANDVTSLRHVYKVDQQHVGILSKTAASFPNNAPAPRNPNRILYLAFTSGTTGTPKGVMHSDNTLLANARALSRDWKITDQSVIYTMSPLSHNLGFGAMVLALFVGGELVIHDLPRGRSLLDRLTDTGTTFLVGVPTHAIDLLEEIRLRGVTGVGKLKGFRISGAPAPREVVAGLLQYGVIPQSGYGMTETCSHQYTLPNDDPKLIIESCGKSCPGYEVRIFRRDNADVEAPVREVGQIGGRGASLMLGYFDDQTSTEDSFNRDGWFMTSDLGWIDEQGYLRITGRKKDVIIRGGHNIFPARIEALALRHNAIQRVVAVPVRDSRLGEKVCLVVMLQPGKTVTADDMLNHLDAAGLSKYEMPEYFVQVEEIPLTASGKIRKRDIAELIAQGQLRPTAVRWQAKSE